MGIPKGLVPPGTENMNNVQCAAEEREEGEIIDDFEDIISSDEELTMKKRIEELEERNLELEKIANISEIFNYEISTKELAHTKERFELKNVAVSDISDNDDLYLPPQKTYKVKHRTKKSSKIVPSHSIVNRKNYLHERNYARDDKSATEQNLRSRAKSRKRKYPKLSTSRSRKKSEKIRKKEISENRSSSEDEICALNRDELRFALKRDVKVNIRNDLVGNMLLDKKAFIEKKQPVVLEQIIDLVNDSEKEENVISNVEIIDTKDDTDDSVSLEEQELRLIALKSAIMKKAIKRKKRKESEDKKPYSPSEFVELRGTFYSPRNSIESGPMDISPIASPELGNEDNYDKSIDMDLVSSNSSSPILVGHCGTWIPIDKIPITKSKNQPPVIIQSPTPINVSSSSSLVNTPKSQGKIQEDENDTVKINITCASPEPSDEEEMALRALLLSKMRANKESKASTPKVEKEELVDKTSNAEKVNISESQVTETINNNDVDNSLDPEALRQVLLLSMKQKTMNKTEIVLKEAVRRLKGKTQPETAICSIAESHNQSQEVIAPDVNPFPSDMDYRVLNSSLNQQNNDNGAADIQRVINHFESVSLDDKVNENRHDINESERLIVMTNDVPEYVNNNMENKEQFKRIGIACSENVCKTNVVDYKLVPEEALIISNNNETALPILPMNKNVNLNKSLKHQSLSRTSALKTVPITNIDATGNIKTSSVLQNPAPQSRTQPPIDENEKSLPNRAMVKSDLLPVPEKGISKSPVNLTRSALKAVPMVENEQITNIIKAVNIPKMKTKVVRTRTKVVNKTVIPNTQLKRKSVTKVVENSPTKKKVKFDTSLLKVKEIPKATSRLITTIDIPTVQKIVIHLGPSDTDSDEFNTDVPDTSITRHNVILGKDYYDNASPMSLPMDSPCYSPFPQPPVADDIPNTETPNTTSAKKSIVNDIFQARLDAFLKNARTKVEQTKKEIPLTVNVLEETAEVTETATEATMPATPLAVRHLPPSSQLEYRKLVNRMKILEKQKQARNNKLKTNLEKIKVTIKNDQATEQQPDEAPAFSLSTTSNPAPVVPVISAPSIVTPSTNLQRTILNEEVQSTAPSIIDLGEKSGENIQNDTLIKKVIKKSVILPPKPVDFNSANKQDNLEKIGDNNEGGKSPSLLKDSNTTSKNVQVLDKVKKKVETETPAITPKLASTNLKETSDLASTSVENNVDLLETIETDYNKNSSYLSENILKAMELVQVAKQEKTKKLLLQSKLEQLKRDMAKLESELDHRNKHLSKIYPQISEHHKSITELKSKCMKLEKTAKVMGKQIKGRNYVFKSNLIHVNQIYKEFALEVKILKDLKIPQFASGEEMTVEERRLHNEICSNSFSKQDEASISSIEKTDLNSNKTAEMDSSKEKLNKATTVEASNKTAENSNVKINDSSVVTCSEKANTKESTELMDTIEIIEGQTVNHQSSSRQNEIVEDRSELNEIFEETSTITKDESIESKSKLEKAIGATSNQVIPTDQVAVSVNEISMTEDEIDHSISEDDRKTLLTKEDEQIEELNNFATSTHNQSDNIITSTEDIRIIADHKENNEGPTIPTSKIILAEASNLKDDNGEDQLLTLKQEILTSTTEGEISNAEGSQLEISREDGQSIVKNCDSIKDVPQNKASHEFIENPYSNLCSLVAGDSCEEQALPSKESGTSVIEKCPEATKMLYVPTENVEAQSTVHANCTIEKPTEMEDFVKDDSGNEVPRSTKIIGTSNEAATSKIGEYISPLVHLSQQRHCNPNGIICPFQLMGQCDDQQCKYEHLSKDIDETL